VVNQTTERDRRFEPLGVEPVRNNNDGKYRFGEFVARPSSRELTCGGDRIEMGSRAFDMLIVLLRSQGEIVSKNEIIRYVWPSTTVDDSNLRFQMARLRKALGCESKRIKTIPGRGYIFVADEGLPDLPASDELGLEASLVEAPSIIIIDRDPENREAIHRLLRPFRAMVQSFGSVEAFLLSDTPTLQRMPGSVSPNVARQ
jgi:DNA-binding winged helix-turn-helix (wHTH) protein